MCWQPLILLSCILVVGFDCQVTLLAMKIEKAIALYPAKFLSGALQCLTSPFCAPGTTRNAEEAQLRRMRVQLTSVPSMASAAL